MAISLRQAVDVIVNGPEQDCIVLVSPPGTGKSCAVVNAARKMGANYLPVYAATMEAVDARGLPYLKDAGDHKLVGWAAPSFLPLDLELKRHDGGLVLVNFDDWFQAPPPVLRATVRSIYGDGGERRIGDFPIYRNTRFVATGNREQDRAGVYRPETYVNDRITYIEIEPDVDEWVSGALAGFAQPSKDEGYPEMRARINKAVAQGVPDVLVAFIRWSKQVYDFQSEQRSFLSPRSIERLGRFMRAFDVAGINGDMLQEVANGTIGEANAAKFMAFYKLREQLPDTDDILAGKDVKLPVRTEILFILATTIARAAKKEHVPAVTKLICRMADLKNKNEDYVGVEPSVYLTTECLRGANTALTGVKNQKEWYEWAKKNAKFFLES